VSDKSCARETLGHRSDELADDHIQRLLRNADRLAFGVRPRGFVLINRTRLLAASEISSTGALLIDEWVVRAGGGVQPVRRAAPETVHGHRRRTRPPATIVWRVPARALKHNARA
jgi:hypothetical protein